MDLRLKDRILLTAVRFPPLRWARVRRALRYLWQSAKRVRRHRAERRGDERYSRPALYDMETKLERYLPARGFFVEAGAYDGYVQSNTYYLERFKGWRGLLVEPIPELYRRAKKERVNSRVVSCALVGPERSGQTVRMQYAGTMSIAAGARGAEGEDEAYLASALLNPSALLFPEDRYEVAAHGRTLSELLDEAGSPEVDLLSLDLEGFEAEAIDGLDLDRHAPRFILVEIQDESCLEEIDMRLAGRYRRLGWLSPYDLLFARNESAEGP